MPKKTVSVVVLIVIVVLILLFYVMMVLLTIAKNQFNASTIAAFFPISLILGILLLWAKVISQKAIIKHLKIELEKYSKSDN